MISMVSPSLSAARSAMAGPNRCTLRHHVPYHVPYELADDGLSVDAANFQITIDCCGSLYACKVNAECGRQFVQRHDYHVPGCFR